MTELTKEQYIDMLETGYRLSYKMADFQSDESVTSYIESVQIPNAELNIDSFIFRVPSKNRDEAIKIFTEIVTHEANWVWTDCSKVIGAGSTWRWFR